MSIESWEDEGGGLYDEDTDLYSLDEQCQRCGEFYEEPGRPCVYCGFDPLYD